MYWMLVTVQQAISITHKRSTHLQDAGDLRDTLHHKLQKILNVHAPVRALLQLQPVLRVFA